MINVSINPVVAPISVVTLRSTPYLLMPTGSDDQYMPLVGSNCWTVGRSYDNNFVLSDRWISRNHAMLQCTENGDFYLIDLGSRNGTFVNGRRVSIPVTLRNGDHLTFGQTELEFYCPPKAHKTEPSEPIHKDTQTSILHVRRLISVMVVDIRNFTVLTHQLDETSLSVAIGSWFRESGEILKRCGSWVDKYIGDAIMAIWFHGSEGVSDQEAMSILQAVNDLNKMTTNLSNEYPLPFPLRIGTGINTGMAIVGNTTGSGDRPEYTAIGDTVIAAFRLESATKELGLDIALGEDTYRYVSKIGKSELNFKQHTVNLKGYDNSTITYAGTYGDLENFLRVNSTLPIIE
ncbi:MULTISPECIES: adenylate/guanylate cyclase domain-containing protein [unclassified Moorena]|uniref:adenylate/guanylate cyclase domain-containing protein n=1 Tax=unclassified Moorena TaxID=2683338 RepID=UPI0025E8D1C3|nr:MULTISPECIES: adenylate/guanylate cyclase domain-containing protein [unclassified Moorena]